MHDGATICPAQGRLLILISMNIHNTPPGIDQIPRGGYLLTQEVTGRAKLSRSSGLHITWFLTFRNSPGKLLYGLTRGLHSSCFRSHSSARQARVSEFPFPLEHRCYIIKLASVSSSYCAKKKKGAGSFWEPKGELPCLEPKASEQLLLSM